MTSIEDDLFALARGIWAADAKEMVRRRAQAEANLETVVRCALRTGTGRPDLMRWLRGALPAVTGGSDGGVTVDRAAPVLARMLCRTLINECRQPQPDDWPAACETVIVR